MKRNAADEEKNQSLSGRKALMKDMLVFSNILLKKTKDYGYIYIALALALSVLFFLPVNLFR